jgi:hypothetical protein
MKQTILAFVAFKPFFKIRTKDTNELYALYEGQDTLTRMCELS